MARSSDGPITRSKMTDFEKTVLSDLSTLKAQMRQLTGNGQPGRLHQLEARVEQHERWLQRAQGVGALVAALLTLAHWAIDYLK
jgi:hypothetical protein